MDDCATPTPSELTTAIKEEAVRLGFELVGIAPAVTPEGLNPLFEWIEAGYAGEMGYIERRREAYSHPEYVQQQAKSLVVCVWNYHSGQPRQPETGEGRVARYAWSGGDYHDYLRAKLQELALTIREASPQARTRCAVDTAPLLERDFSRLAGLGWFGKNTMLINKKAGSWLLLGVVLVDQELQYDAPHATSHCGTCTRCLEACPTDAFVEPYVLDARKCISYLTIELKESIPLELRDPMGDWLFGCDICQEVCPWNRKAPISTAIEVQPREDLNPISARRLLTESLQSLKQQLGASPLLRPGREGLLRNAAIVLGNQRDQQSLPILESVLKQEDSELIRGACAWALGKIGGAASKEILQVAYERESTESVQQEIQQALRQIEENGG